MTQILTGVASNGTLPYQSFIWAPSFYLELPFSLIAPAAGVLSFDVTSKHLTTTQPYYFKVIDSHGCFDQDTTIVTVGGEPLSATISASPMGICFEGGSIQLNAQGVNGAGSNVSGYPYTYTWSSNKPVTPSIQNVASPLPVTPVQSGDYIFSVIVSDGYTTLPAQNITVTVHPLPVQQTVTGGGSYCAGGEGLHIGLSGKENGVSYQLFNGTEYACPAVIASGTGPIDFGVFTEVGTYTVVATNPNTTCTDDMTGDASISINPKPIAVANNTPTIPIPHGTSTTFANSSVNIGNEPFTYSWIPTTSIFGPSNILHPTTKKIYGATLFTFYVTDANDCKDTATVSVVMSGPPLGVNATATPGEICFGEDVQLTATGTGGNGSYTYSWVSSPAGYTSTQQNPVVSPAVTTNYTITVNDGFNTHDTTVAVVVNQLPVLYSTMGGGEFCDGDPGPEVHMLNSENGITYTLWHNTAATTNVVTGSGSPITFGEITTPGIYYVRAENGSTACWRWMSDTVSVVKNPLPQQFIVNGGGSYPSGGVGMPVGLSGSQTGIDYMLYLDGAPAIAPPGLPGTDLPLDFGMQTLAGLYTVRAINPLTGCFIMMNGDATVIINPYPNIQNVTGGGQFCQGEAGKEVGLDDTEIGVLYILYRNLDSIGNAIGTGDALAFGTFDVAGNYTVKGINTFNNLERMMRGSATITVNPLPVVFSLVPSGERCPGTELFVNGSQNGFQYILYRNNNEVDTVTGNGQWSLLPLGARWDTGYYWVRGVNPLTGCGVWLHDTTRINPSPFAYHVMPAGILCQGQPIWTDGSDVGISYQLIRDENIVVGASQTGTGGPLSFGPQTYPGTYKVLATDEVTDCSLFLLDSAVLYPAPVAFSILPAGDTCAPAEIFLSSSETGYTYGLYFNNEYPPLQWLTGNGATLSFGSHSLAGDYTIKANNMATQCETDMAGVLTLYPSPLVYNIQPGGLACAGATISLDNSQTGITYQLYLNDSLAIGPPVAGTGLPLTMGVGSLPGQYTVIGYNLVNSCSMWMNGMATLLPDPGLFSITPAGQHCSGVTIGLNGSEAGVAYRLIRDNQTTTPVAVLTGTGGLLSYGPQHVPGVYTVVAFRPLSGCTAVMEETVTVNPRPLAFDVLPLGANCEPDDVTLSGSQTEVSYELLLNGFPLTAPVIVPGTGLPISFGPQMGGQYTVMATNTATLCQMPMNGQAMISSQPVVMAGPDTLLCSSDLLPLSGSAVGYSALNWTTSGDGLFSDITILNPVYSPGTADLASGSVVLTLSAAGTPECPATAVSDELTVTFHPTPVANAGSDAVACAGLTAQLNGSGLNYGLIEWTTTGDGQISDPTILNPVYQPGNDDELAGTVRLILTLHGDATCTHIAHSDTLTLIIEPLPVAQAGSDTTICQLHQAWLHGSVTHATTVQWSTQLGDGTFSAPGSLHTFYSPGANDILTGAVKLVLSATGTGTCATVTRSDTLTLTIHPMAQVSAGTDLDVCASQEVMTLQGTASNYSNPVWNTTGFGNLLTPNLLTTPYERDPSDTIARSAMMWLTVNGTNQCINATTADTMMVTFQPLPVSVAGADTFVCQGYPITLSGVNHHSNGVNWTSLTDGIFNNPALLSPEYMPGPAGWASGSMNLVMTAWGTGTCSNETDADTVNLAVVMLPTSVLSGADTICQGDAATIRVDLTGMPPWTLSCTSGLESFNISGITESPFLLSVVPEVTSTYYITAMNDLHCTAEEITGFATIRVNPAPQPYTLTTPDGNIYCENEPGTEVRLNGSQTDVSYQLYLAGIATGSPVPGTGLPLSFGVQTVPGFYSAIGTHVLTGCSSVMNDTLQLIMWPGPDVDFTAGDACHGQPTLFTLTGTDIASIATWEWNFGDGFTAAYITAVDPVHQYPTWGTFLVTMTATDIHGCVTTLVHEVEVSEIPTALFTFEDGLCKNDTVRFSNLSTTATGFINTSHWNYGDGTSGAATFPSAQDGAHRYANAGTYQVTLTVTTDRGCTDVLSRTVTVTSGPNASFVNSSGCAGQAVQFTDATIALTGSPINEWNWDFGDPASGIANGSVLQHPQHVFTVAGTYNVTMTVTTGSGCQSSKTRTVVVATKPVAAFSADTACLSLPTQFSDLSVPNSAFITSWDWDFGDGTAHGSGQNPAHVYAQTGLFMTRLTVTNSNGCIHDTAAYVKVAMAPTALFSTSGGACAGQDVTFHDLSVAPENYLGTWHWDFGDGSPTVTITAPANPDVVHSYGGTGNYLATLTVTTNLGCQSVYSKMVGVQNGPIASFVTPTIRCEAEPVQFTDQSVMNGGSAITSRSWNFGDPASGIGNTSTLTHPVHNFTAAGSYAVSLKIMTALGCTDSVSYTVTVNARPQASFTVDTVCMGTASVFTDQSVAGSGIITNWYWDFGDGATPGLLQNPQHTYANFGTYNVALTVTNSAGCQRDTIHQAVVSDHPDAAFTHTTSNCAGHEVYFTNQSVATNGYVVRWNWLFGDGSSTVVHFPSIPDVTHIYQSAGTYYATLTITTSDSCQDSRTETVTIVPNPTAGFEADNSCVDEAVQFTDQSTNNNGGPVVSWMWDFGDPISGTNNTSVLQNPMHVFDTAGSYPVQLIISNINGCSDTITRLTIISPLPVARFGADSVCFGTPTHFADSSTANAPTLNNWLWNFGDGTTSVYQNPDHLYGQWGSYEVNLSVTNANGCQHDTVQPVFVKPMPAAAFDFVGNCAQTAVQFSDISATPAGVINTWLWDFGDGTTDTLQNPVHEFANGGSYEVTLTVTNSFGCIHSMSQTVHIKRRPSADFASQSVFCPGGQVSFQDLSIGNGTPVTVRRWDFGDGFTSTAANPVYNYVFADSCYNVSLVIINEAGCSDTTSQTVCVKPAYRLTLNHEPACAGVPALFSALNEAAGDTLLNVVWTFGDPASGSLNLSTDNPAVHVFENPGFYSVKLKGWNSEYCLDSTYVVLQILPQPEAAFFWDKTVLPCADSTVTFFNLSTGNGAPIDSLVWNFGDGTSTTQPGAIPFVTHKFSHFGVFGVSLTAYVSNGCSHSVTHTATVKCLSSYFDLVSEPACQGATLMIADSSAPSLAIGDWLWLFGDGEYEQYAAFKPIVTHTYDAPGTYEVKLTTSAQVNGNNISDVFTRTITVAASPSAAFTTNTLCSGDSVRFTDQSVTLNGAIAQWHWSFGEGDTSSRQNPVHSYANDTSFLVSLVVVNDSGCRDTAQRQINLFPRPVVMLSPRSGAFCGNGYTVTFRDTSGIVYPMYQWIWEPGDTLVSTADSALHTFPDGHHQVILTVTTESGCVNSDTAQIVTMPSPRAAMTVDPARAPITKPEFMFTDQSVTMGNSPLIRWEWIIGDTVFSTAQSVPYNFNLLDSARPDTGVHRVTLRVYNMDGCTDSTSRTIYLDPELVLITPTAFTPNRNGINDTFKPYIKYEMTGSYLMQIFNRWGQMVFETTDHTVGWNGNSAVDNSYCQAGMYAWIITLNNPQGVAEAHTGTVMLVR